MKIVLRFYTLFFALIISIVAGVDMFAAEEDSLFPANPNIASRYDYVADPAGVISDEQERQINARLDALRESTTVEMAVAVVPTIGDMEIQPYAVDLFERWGIGHSDNDNGVLIVVDTGKVQAFILTGYGVEGVLTDAVCARLFRNNLAPGVRAGKVGEALISTVDAASEILSTPEAAEELRSAQGARGSREVEGIDSEVLHNFIYLVVFLVFISSMILFIRNLIAGRKLDNYGKSLIWKSNLWVFWICAVLSAGTALPFALMALFLYRSMRNRRRKCDVCGAKMQKLNEKDDNAYLNLSQDFEEGIGTVDYDVWLCPRCGAVERFPFKIEQKQYKTCPACHTIAMRLKQSTVLRQPTATQEGMGVNTYECEFCHHREDHHFRIPKKDDDAAAALLAGAALGALGRGGGGFGGGGFGGGFGGGSTGGGGAGGAC